METHTVNSLSELTALMRKHLREREKRVRAAARKAAKKGVSILKRKVPVAHGEIRESVHADDTLIVVDAPHAAAVNNGSRPHTPPLGPLVEWVRLRGMQGLQTERQLSRLPGTSTKESALGVAAMLREHEVRGPGGYSHADAAVQVARAIQQAIRRRGTKPHHFVEKAMPELRALLGAEINAALAGSSGDGGGGGDPPKGGGPGGSVKSGAYRKHANTYRGAAIQTNAQGQRFATLKNGKTVFLKH